MTRNKTSSRIFVQPGNYSVLLAIAWTIVIGISMLVAISSQRREIISIAKNVARAYIDKDLLFREWVALHGGIYVPISDMTPPNLLIPYGIVPEREVTTPAGQQLTFVNPSYLTRQLYDLAEKEKHISGHITSLKPLSPHNQPDAWETEALQAFERGAKEYANIAKEGSLNSLRLMRPLLTDENCLPCHLQQGYKAGDIRGGISIKLPMGLFEAPWHEQIGLVWLGHGIIWILGLTGIYAGYCGLKRRTNERDRAEEELHRVNALLESQATTDFLTGITNRRKFIELLEAYIREAKRYTKPLALIFFDIDHFKAVNDTFGHETGDRVLRELAFLVNAAIRETDIFARFGGEEFIILVHNNDVETGRELAEKIRHIIEHHDFPVVHSVTCSFGVAQFYPDDIAEILISRADEAMYAAKQSGRNRVETRCDCHRDS